LSFSATSGQRSVKVIKYSI